MLPFETYFTTPTIFGKNIGFKNNQFSEDAMLAPTIVNEWAKNTLNEQELVEFNTALAANNTKWQAYQDQQLVLAEPIFETVYSAVLDSEIEIQIGEKFVLTEGVDLFNLELHPDFVYWYNRFITSTGYLV